MKTLVIANHKGGVGKSAIATMLAHFLAQRGLRVLAIDLDHQSNFSSAIVRSARARLFEVSADGLMTNAVTAAPNATFVLVPGGPALIGLERQAALHSPFARNLRGFLRAVNDRFDVCVVDTNPNPDIRMIAALASADHVLSPFELNQEAMDGVSALLNHERVGLRKIKAVLNPKLNFMGLLPTKVEATPFQRANLQQVVQQYRERLIPIGPELGQVAWIPKRSAVAEAQAQGEVLWEMKKSAARDAWKEMEPSISRIAALATSTAAIRDGAAA